jgi:hypothetical protein
MKAGFFSLSGRTNTNAKEGEYILMAPGLGRPHEWKTHKNVR